MSLRILTVGAYELDGFGDQMFLLVTRQYFPHAQLVAAAPFGADMSALIDEDVHPYGSLLGAERFDVIWTVGGEIGGAMPRSVYARAVSKAEYKYFERLPFDEQDEHLRCAAGHSARIVSAYIPPPLAYKRNSGAITVINSVGISHARFDESVRDERMSLLRGTTFVSVRDKESSEMLSSHGIDHFLAPDAVHAIGILRPATRYRMSPVAIFQIYDELLTKLGPDSVASALTRCVSLQGMRLRIFIAGIHRGSDSLARNQDLVDRIKRLAPGRDVAIIPDRRPLDLSEHLRQARIVVSNSLHVRIVASTYNVPRVSLADSSPKVRRYARKWDAAMPYEVALPDLDPAISRALSMADNPRVLKRGRELAELAHSNLKDLVDRVTTLAVNETDDDRKKRAQERRENTRPTTLDCTVER